jgi:DNA-directed RNA polymerase specialized sigma subunit
MEYNLIQTYIKDMNEALGSCSEESTIRDFYLLMQLESRFAKRLRSVAGGKQVYKDFIQMIIREKENIMTSRRFFREREESYKEHIFVAIRKREAKDLHSFRINFMFCAFAIKNLKKQDSKLTELFNDIKQIRESLISRYLHYALVKAKSFNNGVNYNNDFGDLIQIANEALVDSVDKFVLDENGYSFRHMAIGRMIASLIASGDLSLAVTFGPQASRRLHKIKKVLEKTPGLSTRQLSEVMGIAEEEVSAIINASQATSLDADLGEDNSGDSPTVTLQEFLPAPTGDYTDPYVLSETSDLIKKATIVFNDLTILEQKILRLKGINFDKYL